MKKALLVILIAIAANVAIAQTILNGSFEGAGVSCIMNATNHQFDSIVPNVTGIGKASQIDIQGSSTCSTYGTAEDGTYFLGMISDYYNDAEDAVALKLSSPLTKGQTYKVSFYYRQYSTTFACLLEFGVSMNDSTFGTLMSSPANFPTNTWGQRTVTFTPTIDAKYITVRTNTQGGGWTEVDNIVLQTPTGINEINTANVHADVFPNPMTDKTTIHVSADQTLEKAELVVFNAIGSVVKRLTPVKENTFEFQKENCPTGIYFYQIINENKPVYTGKIMVE